MNDVPLVNENDINSINISIIAIKKQLRQLNEAVGLIDTPDVNIDLTSFVKKSDVVDTVQSGNLNPVTSNAVANALSYSTMEQKTGGMWIDGRPIYRRVFNCIRQLSFSAQSWVNLTNTYFSNITDLLGVDTIVNCIVHSERKTYMYNPFIFDTKTNNQIRFYGVIGNIFNVGSTISVEYTKTSDTATRSIPSETKGAEEETKEEETKEEEPIEEPKEEEKK